MGNASQSTSARSYGLLLAIWSVLLGGSLLWAVNQETRNTLDIADAAARANISKDLAFRRWATSHGGVYVPPTEHTPPNPYLKVPNRDVVTTTGKKLTLMNPAYMLREMQTDFPGDYGTRSHITSLKLLNPKNAPDAWEEKALHAFDQGEKERVEVQQIDGQPYLRMMRPLIVEAGCLKCHAFQGYKVGDIRGGLSTAIALTPYLAREQEFKNSLALTHGTIWLIGLAGLVFSYRHGRRQAAEREKTANELKESEEKFSAISAAVLDALIMVDDNSALVYWNPAAERILGYRATEVLGKPLHEMLTPPRYRNNAIQGFNAFRNTGQGAVIGKTIEIEALHKDGREIPIELSISALKLKGRWHAVGILRDITEKKRMQDELQEQERLSQSLLRLSRNLERSQTYAEVLDAARDEVRGVIGYQNLWAYLFTGDKKYARALVAGGPISDTVMSEDGTATLSVKDDRMLEEIAEAKEIVLVVDARTDERVNKEIVSRLGNRTIVNVPIILFDRHLGSVGMGTFGDEGVRVPSVSEQAYLMALASHMAAALDRIHLLAERKQAENKIIELNRDLESRVAERTAQLEDANKELESFSYSVSHDLRTPLRAIDGFSHILLEDYGDKLEAEGKRLLNVVRDNTVRMGQLIDDILNFSRAGRLDINYAEIDMEQLAHAVIEELHAAISEGKVQLEVEHIPRARGDSAMMHQVFVNLLSNAIKFSRNSEPAKIRVGGYIEADEAVYYVKDNGAGFDMQYADKLFGVFQRLHGVNEFEGTGIGLAIVKRIVTRHGGRVWAEGKINEGATICFALPRADRLNE